MAIFCRALYPRAAEVAGSLKGNRKGRVRCSTSIQYKSGHSNEEVAFVVALKIMNRLNRRRHCSFPHRF